MTLPVEVEAMKKRSSTFGFLPFASSIPIEAMPGSEVVREKLERVERLTSGGSSSASKTVEERQSVETLETSGSGGSSGAGRQEGGGGSQARVQCGIDASCNTLDVEPRVCNWIDSNHFLIVVVKGGYSVGVRDLRAYRFRVVDKSRMCGYLEASDSFKGLVSRALVSKAVSNHDPKMLLDTAVSNLHDACVLGASLRFYTWYPFIAQKHNALTELERWRRFVKDCNMTGQGAYLKAFDDSMVVYPKPGFIFNPEYHVLTIKSMDENLVKCIVGHLLAGEQPSKCSGYVEFEVRDKSDGSVQGGGRIKAKGFTVKDPGEYVKWFNDVVKTVLHVDAETADAVRRIVAAALTGRSPPSDAVEKLKAAGLDPDTVYEKLVRDTYFGPPGTILFTSADVAFWDMTSMKSVYASGSGCKAVKSTGDGVVVYRCESGGYLYARVPSDTGWYTIHDYDLIMVDGRYVAGTKRALEYTLPLSMQRSLAETMAKAIADVLRGISSGEAQQERESSGTGGGGASQSSARQSSQSGSKTSGKTSSVNEGSRSGGSRGTRPVCTKRELWRTCIGTTLRIAYEIVCRYPDGRVSTRREVIDIPGGCSQQKQQESQSGDRGSESMRVRGGSGSSGSGSAGGSSSGGSSQSTGSGEVKLIIPRRDTSSGSGSQSGAQCVAYREVCRSLGTQREVRGGMEYVYELKECIKYCVTPTGAMIPVGTERKRVLVSARPIYTQTGTTMTPFGGATGALTGAASGLKLL